MPVTLARRIRRIGFLPKLKLEDLVGPELMKKVKDRTVNDHEREKYNTAVNEVFTHPRKLTLTPEETLAATDKLRELYPIEKGHNFTAPKSNYRRSKSRRKAAK